MTDLRQEAINTITSGATTGGPPPDDEGARRWDERDLAEHDGPAPPDRNCYTLPNGDCVGACRLHNGYDPEKKRLPWPNPSGYLFPLLYTAVDPERTIHPPVRQHDTDCGYDLYVAEDCAIPPGEDALVGHNLRVQLPPGTWGLVIGRSSNWKRKLEIGLGVIDNGYRGPLYARAFNMSDEDQIINKGDRIAQLILVQMFVPPALWTRELDESERGERGFGSTGV